MKTNEPVAELGAVFEKFAMELELIDLGCTIERCRLGGLLFDLSDERGHG
jgi:hypothetical protein